MSLLLYLVEDAVARRWSPLADTRPVGEILHGSFTLRERIERATGLVTAGYLADSGLEGFPAQGVPEVTHTAGADTAKARLLLSSRYVPPLQGPVLPEEGSAEVSETRIQLTAAGAPAGWLLPPGFDPPPESTSDRCADAELQLPGRLLLTPWELMERNTEQLADDLAALGAGGPSGSAAPLADLPGVHLLGPKEVSAEEGVTVDPQVVLDTRSGPIHLASRVHVRSFTHLSGPALIGADSILLGGTIEAVSCGPGCKLRGEVSSSIVLGHSNKAHDGYLGHSLVGSWVNLGAMTTNSDLKNNYGSIRAATPAGEVDTDLLKLGVFLGDHVKTGIGMALGAGTSVGVGTNLFGTDLPPKAVPAFHWGTGRLLVPYRLDAFLATAERVMGRRGVTLTSENRAFLSRLWDEAVGKSTDEIRE